MDPITLIILCVVGYFGYKWHQSNQAVDDDNPRPQTKAAAAYANLKKVSELREALRDMGNKPVEIDALCVPLETALKNFAN